MYDFGMYGKHYIGRQNIKDIIHLKQPTVLSGSFLNFFFLPFNYIVYILREHYILVRKSEKISKRELNLK